MRHTTHKFQIEKLHIRLILCSWVLLLNFSYVYSQEAMEGMEQKEHNLTSFEINQRNITEELLKLTPDEYESNPDFGYLPYDAPCDSCYELIQKRTEAHRYYVEAGTNGTKFYSQQSFSAINIKNEFGQWVSVDPRLKSVSEGLYKSDRQAVLPTELNILEKQSSFNLPNGEKFAFNRKLEMLYVSPTLQITNLGEANWSNYTVGEDGIRVIEAWPNVDIEIVYQEDRIKSSYIIKAPLGYSNGSIAFRDNLSLPSGYDIHKNASSKKYEVTAPNGEYLFEFSHAVGFDESHLSDRMKGFGYYYQQNNKQLSVIVPVSWMTDIHAVYPLTIDPTVTANATYSAGIMYFDYEAPGLLCPGDGTGGCTYTLTVPKPANATLTGATFDMSYFTTSGANCSVCTLNQAGVFFTSGCGRNPTNTNTFWYCNDATHYGNCAGTGLPIDNLVTCLAPACAGVVPITMHTQRCGCSNVNGCPAASGDCAYMPNNSWSITITGRTLEALPDQMYNPASCSGTNTVLDPGATFGVPGYTYAWNTGATSSTINAPNAGSPYSVVVTDACGVQQTVNFTINCPLSVTLKQFTAERINRKVLLQWETVSETDNDYFVVQRAGEDGQFYDLLKQDAVGNSNTLQHYSTYDYNPLKGTSYYRLQIYDKQGNISTSEVKSIGFDGGSELSIVPNPNTGTFQIAYNFPENGNYLIELLSVGGKQLNTQNITVDKAGYKEIKLTHPALNKGVYFLKLHTQNQVIVKKIVVE